MVFDWLKVKHISRNILNFIDAKIAQAQQIKSGNFKQKLVLLKISKNYFILVTGFTILSPIFTTISASAAENLIISIPPLDLTEPIVVSLPPFQLKIPIESIERFAKEGEFSEEFTFYSELLTTKETKEIQTVLKKQKQELRELFQKRFDVNPTIVNTFMEEPAGQEVLKRLGKILKTGENKNGSEALQTAFQLAIEEPDGLTIINLLKNFPGDLLIEFEEGINLTEELIKRFVEERLIVTELQNQALERSLSEKKIDFNSFPDLRQPGNITWEKQSFTFRNPNRDRSSPANIYLPKNGGNQLIPVIVISHGLGSDLNSFAYLAEHLASHGFAVIVPEHIGSSAEKLENIFAGFSRPVDGMEFINRPLDIKYLLDKLEVKIDSDPIWRGQLNFQQVGIIGQSFGGYTALSLAGAPLDLEDLRKDCQSEDTKFIFNLSLLLQCQTSNLPTEITNNLRDERITAAIAINPISSGVFGPEKISKIAIPLMIVASTRDIFAPPIPEQIYPFISLTTTEKYLVISEPATHFSFIGVEEEEEVSIELPIKLIGPDPNLAYPFMQTLGLAFFQTYLINQSQSLPYLSGSYLQFINQQPFNFSVLRSLTEEDLQQAIDSFSKRFSDIN
ncbi:MAG: alpha/beta hydrolase [Cyanobacteriota bacterium]|nr:alpha/beta hydrolase [Cyanobacteriota bacterium]